MGEGGEKTEEPTSKRLEEARKKGQIAVSKDLTGGLVFIASTDDNRFRALDSKTGKQLWVTKLPRRGNADPITYRGRNGKQYVAVLSGVGGWAGAVVAGDLDIRDPSGALGFVNAMRELPKHTTKGGMLYVFALP